MVLSGAVIPLYAAPRPEPAPATVLDTVSVSASPGGETVGEATSTVTVIDAEEIERRGHQDIQDLVRYEPGVSVRDQGRFGLDGIAIRGLGGNRVLIQVDGVPVADAFAIGSFSNAGRDLVDIDTLKQVEILRGPASVLYGSDALGGVVSFVTRDPRDYLGAERAYVGAKTGYASVDDSWTGRGTFALGNEHWSGMVSGTHRAGAERATGGTNDSDGATRTAPNPQDVDSDALLAKLVFEPGVGQQWRLTADGYDARTQTEVLSARTETVVGTTRTRVTDLDGDDTQRRERVALDYRLASGVVPWLDHADLTVYRQQSDIEQITREQRVSTNAAGVQTPSERSRQFDFEQDQLGVEAVLGRTWQWGAHTHDVDVGFNYLDTDTAQRRDGWQRNLLTGVVSTTISPDSFPVRDFPLSRTREYALFMQDRIALLDGRLTLTPALRHDRFDLKPEPDAIFTADNPGVVPVNVNARENTTKLGARYTLGDTWALVGQYAEGFRAPPYNDVNIGFTNLAFGYTAAPNPDLRAETSRGIELGARAQGEFGYFTATTYFNRYEDFIESLVALGTDPTTGLLVFQSQNLTEVTIHGAELRGALELGALSPALRHWRLDAAAAWARGEDQSRDVPLNSIDPVTAVLGLSYRPDADWSLEFIARGARAKTRVDDSAGELARSPGYVAFDLIGQVRLSERARLSAAIYNLADRRYLEWADLRGRLANDPALDRFAAPGREFNLTLNWDF
jgi:hemoglobin/transferrin/lactoferrin receptor protein